MSDVTSSSEQSSGRGRGQGLDHVTSHLTGDDVTQSPEDASSSEKWALVSLHTLTHTHTLSLSLTLSPLHPRSMPSHPHTLTLSQASKYCADAKDYLEMMCRDLSSELNQFDLQKELELKQVLMEYATRQLERHEKVEILKKPVLDLFDWFF